MKKTFYCLVGLMMVLGLVFSAAPKVVSASPVVEEPYTPSWVFPLDPSSSFQAVNIELAAQNAPSWMQKFSDGITISKPTKICYTFRHGRFHWVPKILQLKNGKWSTLATTSEYLYGEEASLYACAKPVEAGTFALFAYYNGPAEAAVSTSAPKLFTVAHWTITSGIGPRPYDFGNIIAYDVNWQGYPTATRLAWGIEMCWESASDCHAFPDGYLNISPSGYPYPQHLDVTVMDGIYMSFSGSGGFCRFAPFVELLDASNNVLDRIYFISDYVNNCVS